MDIRVFKLDDCEWWAGESLVSCLIAAREQAGVECYDDPDEQCEVLQETLEHIKFVDEDGSVRTMAEELRLQIEAGTTFPCILAATEW